VLSRMLSGGGACTAGRHPPPPRHTPAEAAPPLMGGRHASRGWSEGGSQLLEARLLAATTAEADRIRSSGTSSRRHTSIPSNRP
jgi:hypothetical protein